LKIDNKNYDVVLNETMETTATLSWPGKKADVTDLKPTNFTAGGLQFSTSGQFTLATDAGKPVFGIISYDDKTVIVPVVEEPTFETLQIDVVPPETHPFDYPEGLAKFGSDMERALKEIGSNPRNLTITKDLIYMEADKVGYEYGREGHPTFEVLRISGNMDLATARWMKALGSTIFGPCRYRLEGGGYNVDTKCFELTLERCHPVELLLNSTKTHKNPFWSIGCKTLNIRYIHAAFAYIVFSHPEFPQARGMNEPTYESLDIPCI
jgi:hypothetical protein